MPILSSKDHYSRDPVQVQSCNENAQNCIDNVINRPWCLVVARVIKSSRHQCSKFGGTLGRMPRKNLKIHIDVSHSRQPLVKGERLVRYEVNTVMLSMTIAIYIDVPSNRHWCVPCAAAKMKMPRNQNLLNITLASWPEGVLLPANVPGQGNT